MTRSADGTARNARSRPPQHISNIAHLFFSEETAAARPQRRLALAAATDGPAAALAAAGLLVGTATVLEAAGSDGAPDIELWEPPGCTWSARSHLDPSWLAALPGGARWRLRGPLPDRGGREPAASAGPLVRWHHLGAPAGAELAALELTAPGAATREGGSCGRDGLVWCAGPGEAAAWSGAHRLGRLVRALDCRRLEVLILSAGFGAPGRSTAGPPPAVPEADLVRRRARQAGVECPLTVTVVGPLGGGDPGLAAAPLLLASARRLLDGAAAE